MDWKNKIVYELMSYDFPPDYRLDLIKIDIILDIIYFEINYRHLIFTNYCTSDFFEFTCLIDKNNTKFVSSIEEGLLFMKKVEEKLIKHQV